MLFHASRSRYIDPGRPPAAAGGLRSQYPDLVLGAQQPLDCRQLRQAGRRVLTRSFDTRSKASIDLVALAIKSAVGASPDDQLDGHGAKSVRGPLPHSTTSQGARAEETQRSCGLPDSGLPVTNHKQHHLHPNNTILYSTVL